LSEKELARYKKALGNKLKEIRQSNKQSLLEADYNSKFNESNISKYELGKRDLRFSTILDLAKMLKVHPKELFDFEFDLDTPRK
jgi:transcriptional regulator with XRE-family HTH domain